MSMQFWLYWLPLVATLIASFFGLYDDYKRGKRVTYRDIFFFIVLAFIPVLNIVVALFIINEVVKNAKWLDKQIGKKEK